MISYFIQMDEFDHIDNRSINRVMVQLMVSMVSYGKFMLPHQSTFDMAKYLRRRFQI